MRIIFSILLSVFAAVLPAPAQPPLRIYAVLAEECPISIAVAPTLAALQDDASASVKFFAIFPVKTSTPKTAKTFLQRHRMAAFVHLDDETQTLTKSLGATVTPEIILTDSAGIILYRGRINDAWNAPGRRNNRSVSRDAEWAIGKALRGEAISQPWPEAVGCAITFRKTP